MLLKCSTTRVPSGAGRLSAPTFNDLTCRELRLVASDRVKRQITLHRGRFFLTFHFIFTEKAMADVANKYAENVPGKFYVDDQCIDCALGRESAPANFERDAYGGQSHDYRAT